jgi:hypothetical protein
MRARDRHVPGAGFGLDRGLVGTGDALDPPPSSLADAVLAATATHGEKAGRMLSRFAGLPDGVFVWTSSAPRAFHLGRVAGTWRYDDSPEAREVGIHHVRPAHWLDRTFDSDEAPAAVVATFARGGRNFQRINDADAERRTAELWSEHGGDRWPG